MTLGTNRISRASEIEANNQELQSLLSEIEAMQQAPPRQIPWAWLALGAGIGAAAVAIALGMG